MLQNSMRATKFNVLLTTYEYIIKDKAVLAKVRGVRNLFGMLNVDPLLLITTTFYILDPLEIHDHR